MKPFPNRFMARSTLGKDAQGLTYLEPDLRRRIFGKRLTIPYERFDERHWYDLLKEPIWGNP